MGTRGGEDKGRRLVKSGRVWGSRDKLGRSYIVQNSFDVLGRLRVQLGSNLSQDRFVYLNLSRQITELPSTHR